MKTSLTEQATKELSARLERANGAFARRYPGDIAARRPVHTVYGGAHLFSSDAARKLGTAALRAMDEYAPHFAELARAIGLPGAEALPGAADAAASLRAWLLGDPDGARRARPEVWLAHTLYERVREKLGAEPVEDYRIDFEDGYGVRSWAEEDRQAALAAGEVAKGMAAGTLPPFLGIRIKPLNDELKARSVRTLDIFLSSLCEATGGALPANFVVTLPKVTVPEQVGALAELFDALEPALGIGRGLLKLEVMVEAPQALVGPRGERALPGIVEAAGGRCVAAHFGAFDYTAACGITASEQRLSHPACDFARDCMQVALAGRGILLADGATNVLPVPIHRARAGGPALTEAQRAENRAAIHAAWRAHYEDVRRSLARGFYQGWDLHPAQLVTRYAALYSFFLEGLEAASARLQSFITKAAQASVVGSVFDDAATGQGLLNTFLLALGCGAVTEGEAESLSGLTTAELRSRSFSAIVEGRRALIDQESINK